MTRCPPVRSHYAVKARITNKISSAFIKLRQRNTFGILLLTIVGQFAGRSAFADTQLTITPDLNAPGNRIPDEFCGLSFETKMLQPEGGVYFFSSANSELIALFKSLGVKNLRIGGNSADAATTKIPTEQDLDQLGSFAQAAGVHLIFNLRLKDETDPASDIELAKYLMEHYQPQMDCFTIGNEPNVYFSKYEDYRAQWKRFHDAILAEVPDARFNGPSTTPGKTAWARGFAGDFATDPSLRLITQHSYPGGNAQNIPSPGEARLQILAPKIDKSYESFYKAFVPAVLKHNERYRLEEANSLFHGGAAGVSNSYASALWALDFLDWWASHDAEGINFHTGNHRVTDENEVPGGYDISYSTPTGLKVHPIAYALKTFSFSNEGHSIPVSIKQQADEPLDVTAYGVLSSDKTLVLTLINKESGTDAHDANITIDAGDAYVHGQSLLLKSPENDISLVSGTTLGEATIAGDGTWNGQWSTVSATGSGRFTIQLPQATAVVVRLKRN
jgi:hypothetical protein